MELRLEIKLASVEELSTIAKALAGLQVTEAKPTREPYARTATVSAVEEVHEANEATGDDGMIEVESPFTAHPSEVKATPEPKAKAPTAAEKKAAEKASKKAQEEADRQDRIDRLKASMEANKEIAGQALTKAAPDSSHAVEPVESIVEEIKQLGDRLMAYSGVALEAKQQLTAQVMAKVGVPSGVRPTQLQQPMLGQFRDMYKAAVEGATNPVMGGLV